LAGGTFDARRAWHIRIFLSILSYGCRSSLCGARRQGAQPAALVRGERLERRQLPRWRDGGRRLPNERRLARNLSDAFAIAEIVRAHHGRARQIRASGEHARRDLVAWNGSAISSRDVGRRDARVHRKLAILKDDGSVDDGRVAECRLTQNTETLMT
jgi:hypothetical protein